MPFEIVLAKSIRKDLESIPKKHHSSIRQAIENNLLHGPNLETTNRKSLEQSIQTATWELRCGTRNQHRILYDIQINPDPEGADIIEMLGIVEVIAIGEKRHEKLFIQGREVKP